METLLKSVSGRGIATLTFNRPDRANSYDVAMLDELADGFESLGRDDAVRVIVLRGAGKHFSAGAGIGEGGHPRREIGEVCSLIDVLPKPTIAVVQGACIGGALALASCCDLIIAGREAVFSIPEVRLGFAPGPLIGFFARAVGHRALRRYLLSGERFSAEEAHRIGLVGELCAANVIESVAEKIIDEFLLSAPGAVARAKLLLRKQTPQLSLDELKELQAAFERAAGSDEVAEGKAAFKEKRKPNWYPQR